MGEVDVLTESVKGLPAAFESSGLKLSLPDLPGLPVTSQGLCP